jgi:hypothetical protein
MSEQEELRDDAPGAEPEDEQAERPAEVDWEENEPSPHQGEQGQEPV